MKNRFINLIAVAAAILAVAPAVAQKTPVKPAPGKVHAMPAKATVETISGGVAKDGFKYPSFQVGVSYGTLKGKRVTVDASKAKIFDKAGKFASKDGIKPGASVKVEGKLSGMNFSATKVTILSAVKPVAAPSKGKMTPKAKIK